MHLTARSAVLSILVWTVGVAQFLHMGQASATVFYVEDLHFYDFSKLEANDFQPTPRGLSRIVPPVGVPIVEARPVADQYDDWTLVVHQAINRVAGTFKSSLHELQRNILKRLATELATAEMELRLISIPSVGELQIVALRGINEHIAAIPNSIRDTSNGAIWRERSLDSDSSPSIGPNLLWIASGESVAFDHSATSNDAQSKRATEANHDIDLSVQALANFTEQSLSFLSNLSLCINEGLDETNVDRNPLSGINLTMSPLASESQTRSELMVDADTNVPATRDFYSIVEFDGRAILVPQHIAASWIEVSEQSNPKVRGNQLAARTVQRQVGESLRMAGEWLISVSDSIATSEERIADSSQDQDGIR